MGTSRSEQQLREFNAKCDARNQQLVRAVGKAVRARFAGAPELVDDNYNFFVIGYSPTERPSDAIVSITANAKGVGLCFIRGASLPDPHGVLLGSGSQTRFIRCGVILGAGPSRNRGADDGRHRSIPRSAAGRQTWQARDPVCFGETAAAESRWETKRCAVT